MKKTSNILVTCHVNENLDLCESWTGQRLRQASEREAQAPGDLDVLVPRRTLLRALAKHDPPPFRLIVNHFSTEVVQGALFHTQDKPDANPQWVSDVLPATKGNALTIIVAAHMHASKHHREAFQLSPRGCALVWVHDVMVRLRKNPELLESSEGPQK